MINMQKLPYACSRVILPARGWGVERAEIEPSLERAERQSLIFHPSIRRLTGQPLLPSSGVHHLELILREFCVLKRDPEELPWAKGQQRQTQAPMNDTLRPPVVI